MRQPKQVADLVRGIVRQVGSRAARSELARALDRALGPEQSDQCHITGFRGGRLYVEVEQGPLYAELTGFRADQIRQSINEELPARKVARIVFRMGGTGHV